MRLSLAYGRGTLEIERSPGVVFRVRLAEAAPQAEAATATSQARLF